jgi:hypothetical protein
MPTKDRKPLGGTPARVAIALAIGLGSAAYAASLGHQFSDFDHLHAAARYVLAGKDPYRLIGPDGAFRNRFPLYYPLPAILVMLPFALAPLYAARIAFVGIVSAVFGYALAANGSAKGRYLILFSRQYVECVTLAHWTPLFYAMWFLPELSCLAAIKPTVAGAVVAARGTRRVIVWSLAGAVALSVVSFVAQPHWLGSWWNVVRSADHFSVPLLRPGGFVLVLALLRWRVPEARLLFALSVAPQTPSFYDPLLLFIVASTTVETAILVVAGWALQFTTALFAPFTSMRAAIGVLGSLSIWFLYLPPLILLLRRINVGSVPALVERAVRGLPQWLRGAPESALPRL